MDATEDEGLHEDLQKASQEGSEVLVTQLSYEELKKPRERRLEM